MGAIEDSFKDLGKQIGNIPHVVIGRQERPKVRDTPFQAWKKKYPPQNPQPIPDFRTPMEKRFDLWRNWALISCIIAVVAYSAYRIIKFMWFGG